LSGTALALAKVLAVALAVLLPVVLWFIRNIGGDDDT
jgi:hypothetical protein